MFNKDEFSTLDAEQIKAFKSLKRAFKKCKTANIDFYTVLETIHAVNGNQVSAIDEGQEHLVTDVLDLSYTLVDVGFSGFADDAHRVTFK